MKANLEQAKHNESFHTNICEKFKDKFFDWKITVTFYIAIHYLKGLAAMRGIRIGTTHQEIEQNVNPFAKNKPAMRITNTAWGLYKDLYNYSRTARYDGITDMATFEKLKENDYKHCLECLSNFKKYVKGQKLPIE